MQLLWNFPSLGVTNWVILGQSWALRSQYNSQVEGDILSSPCDSEQLFVLFGEAKTSLIKGKIGIAMVTKVGGGLPRLDSIGIIRHSNQNVLTVT